MDINQTLIEYGLKEKQAKIYVACLELGSSSVLAISQRANLPRSTCEVLLKQLQQMGLVSSFKKKKTKYFSPQDPHKILEKSKQTTSALEKNLPALMALYGTSKNRPNVRYYEGKNGIKMVLREILSEADEILTFGSPDDTYGALPDIWPDFVIERVKKKIPVKVLTRPTQKATDRMKIEQGELREGKIVSGFTEYHAIQMCWGNKIMMLSLQSDLFAIVVESKQLADIHKMLFRYIWKQN